MKTTIDLPDELFHQAKVLAAERSTTLKEIMVQALKQWMHTALEAEEKKTEGDDETPAQRHEGLQHGAGGPIEAGRAL